MSFGNFGFSEILIIAMMVLIFFGPRRMPEIGRAVGGALREFRRGLNEIQRELQEAERAAKIDPDIVPGAKKGSAAKTASKPSTSESPTSELPTPLAAAMASPSEPRTTTRPEAEAANVEEAVDHDAEATGVTAEAVDDDVEASDGAPEASDGLLEASDGAPEQTDEPIKKEEGSERAG
jgi:sec-independent protein translocase protein TatA